MTGGGGIFCCHIDYLYGVFFLGNCLLGNGRHGCNRNLEKNLKYENIIFVTFFWGLTFISSAPGSRLDGSNQN